MKISGTKPIYEEVAEYYEKMISLGVYKAGSFLPSVREVSLESKINPNTVQRGYTLLVQKGIILAIPKKGYQVNDVTIVRDTQALKKEIENLLNSGYTLNQLIEVVGEIAHEKEN